MYKERGGDGPGRAGSARCRTRPPAGDSDVWACVRQAGARGAAAAAAHWLAAHGRCLQRTAAKQLPQRRRGRADGRCRRRGFRTGRLRNLEQFAHWRGPFLSVPKWFVSGAGDTQYTITLQCRIGRPAPFSASPAWLRSRRLAHRHRISAVCLDWSAVKR